MAVHISLELENGSCDDDGHARRTGTVWSGTAHIITAVIGAGVLSLAWSTSQLGWIGGPVALLCFAIITCVSSFLLSDCYRSPHPITGTRNHSYIEAVRIYLGRKQTWVCGLLQYLSLFGTAIAYVITTATSIRAIQKSNCYHKEGHDATCEYGDNIYMLMFGLVQIVMSQIPNFHNMAWLSVVAAIMSFTYASIGLGLGFAKVIENGVIKGSIGGVPADNVADKIWLAFQALGDIAFAYPYSIILLEIQDTLKSPPPENQTMKKASMAAIFITTFFYLCCGCFGFAAFGDSTPGNLLTGFGFYEPYWLVDFANACVVLHLIGGYQMRAGKICSQVEATFKQMDTAGTELECFQALRRQEQLAAANRINSLWEEVQKQKELEQTLQKRYGDLLAEQERVQHLMEKYKEQAKLQEEIAAKQCSFELAEAEAEAEAKREQAKIEEEIAAKQHALELAEAEAEVEREAAKMQEVIAEKQHDLEMPEVEVETEAKREQANMQEEIAAKSQVLEVVEAEAAENQTVVSSTENTEPLVNARCRTTF